MLKLLKLLTFTFFILSFLILCKSLFLDYYPDFSVHYYSPKVIFTGGNPYIAKNEAFIQDVYPPISILLFSPFSILSFLSAERTWAVISLASLFLSVYLIFKLYNKKLFSSLGFLVLGLACFSFPIKFTLGMGQINSFVLLLFVLMVYFLNKNKNYLSAIFLAVSFGIKFFPAFVLPYFVVIKKWKILFIFSLSFIFLSFLAFVVLRPENTFYFYEKVFPSLIGGWKTDYYNQALTGFIGRTILDPRARIIVNVLISLMFFIISYFIVWKTRARKKLLNMHLGLLITLGLIINNFSWQHHFVLMIFPFLATLFYVEKIKNNLRLILIIFISYLLISFNLKNPSTVSVLLQSHVFYGAVLIWMLQALLIWRDFRKQ